MNNEPIYLDTNIYIDHFESRIDRLRPLGEFAYNLLRKSMECEYRIIISNLVIDELEFAGFKEKIRELIQDLMALDKVIAVEVTAEDEEKTRKIRKERNTTFNDTKHAVIANRVNVKFFVTRNMEDFVELQDLVKLKYPENL
ncbi:PIN domain-containing protein [Candidatus Woesearchaeota archaeon]|nr:PIN domain-containing protein [Candidatus Woesearchaeota archaeon]